jgi:hypothetical protein
VEWLNFHHLRYFWTPSSRRIVRPEAVSAWRTQSRAQPMSRHRAVSRLRRSIIGSDAPASPSAPCPQSRLSSAAISRSRCIKLRRCCRARTWACAGRWTNGLTLQVFGRAWSENSRTRRLMEVAASGGLGFSTVHSIVAVAALKHYGLKIIAEVEDCAGDFYRSNSPESTPAFSPTRSTIRASGGRSKYNARTCFSCFRERFGMREITICSMILFGNPALQSGEDP